jgi:hypothetical protein
MRGQRTGHLQRLSASSCPPTYEKALSVLAHFDTPRLTLAAVASRRSRRWLGTSASGGAPRLPGMESTSHRKPCSRLPRCDAALRVARPLPVLPLIAVAWEIPPGNQREVRSLVDQQGQFPRPLGRRRAAETAIAIIVAVALAALALLIGWFRRVSTTYLITNQRLRISGGVARRRVQETRLARVQNVNFDQSVVDRMLKGRQHRFRYGRD